MWLSGMLSEVEERRDLRGGLALGLDFLRDTPVIEGYAEAFRSPNVTGLTPAPGNETTSRASRVSLPCDGTAFRMNTGRRPAS